MNTARKSVRQEVATTMAPRETRRLNRNLQKLAADLGASSKSMKCKGLSTKDKSSATVSITISPPPVLRVHGTPLTFRFPKFSSHFPNLMINKNIVYRKSVYPVLFHQIGVSALFENIGLGAMFSPSKTAYQVLIKQFFGNMLIKSDWITTLVQDKTLSIDSVLLGSLFNVPCSGPYEFKIFIVLD